MDLILVNRELYTFPNRPFPDIFPFNIIFTLIVLPLVTAITIHILKKMSNLHRILTILILAFCMTFVEIVSEKIGWFIHSPDWHHAYTFIGYILFMWVVLKFHRFMAS